MQSHTQNPSSNNVFTQNALLKDELFDGLNHSEKYINPKFFYDEYGSQLFQRITEVDDYYPSRTEKLLLKNFQDEIAEAIGTGKVIIEPGAGSCEKIQLILNALAPACLIPVDISGPFLHSACRQLQQQFPRVDIRPCVADMQDSVTVPAPYQHLPRCVFYPGSTIGNYQPHEALAFLQHVYKTVGTGGGLLIGVDLEKDPAILHQAYNDAEGVTALFNLNVLNHAQQLLNCKIEVDKFNHVAFYNDEKKRIEMHLESLQNQSIKIEEKAAIEIKKGERIHTEYSYKYSLERFARLANQARFNKAAHWVDEQGLFSLQYFIAQ